MLLAPIGLLATQGLLNNLCGCAWDVVVTVLMPTDALGTMLGFGIFFPQQETITALGRTSTCSLGDAAYSTASIRQLVTIRTLDKRTLTKAKQASIAATLIEGLTWCSIGQAVGRWRRNGSRCSSNWCA